MSRETRSNETHAIAFGVDVPLGNRTFVKVWALKDFDQPCNEGPQGFNNILEDEWDVSEERVVALAKKYNIPLEPIEVWKLFD